MNKFDSPKKAKFLASIASLSLESEASDLTIRCKFNFSYFCSQKPNSQDFCDWTSQNVLKLIEKLKEFCKSSLSYWMSQPSGGGTVLAIYGSFPAGSDMTHPAHVPTDVSWGRFRIDQSTRLCGFIIPGKLQGKTHSQTSSVFDGNTFYIVFLDKNHKFYKTEKK